jgi:uncharacterized protein YbbC (DUF1343 family)
MLSGLDCLRRQSFAPLRGLRVGLVTHPAAVDGRLRSAVELFAAAPEVELTALFGPEHGFYGDAQDLVAVAGDGMACGVRCHSLYGSDVTSLRPAPEQLTGLDALVIDLQDVGSRYYTFQATMLFCIEAAFERKLRVVVLDRPNPLGGDIVEGPTIQPGYESFVGIHPVAIRHGMTVGELAKLYVAERNLAGDLLVIPCEGWRRDMTFDETGLPWVMPSPNMPTPDTALVYPGQCLLEGTNASEGRGTTRPFEICGMPGIDAAALAERLRRENLPGVAFRPTWFTPTFQKFAGRLCGGVQLHVLDRRLFQPVRTGLAVLAAIRELAGARFDWRREPYEFVTDRLAIDLLLGSARERLALEAGKSLSEITAAWEAEEQHFRRRRAPHLLYPEAPRTPLRSAARERRIP